MTQTYRSRSSRSTLQLSQCHFARMYSTECPNPRTIIQAMLCRSKIYGLSLLPPTTTPHPGFSKRRDDTTRHGVTNTVPSCSCGARITCSTEWQQERKKKKKKERKGRGEQERSKRQASYAVDEARVILARERAIPAASDELAAQPPPAPCETACRGARRRGSPAGTRQKVGGDARRGGGGH